MIDRREATLLVVKVLLQKGYEWLACDADGTIVAYEVKPFKMTEDEWWNYDSEEPKFLTLDNAHDINFVKWEDEEPVNIREWLEKEEKEMKMYSVKDGELECREVDADFFEKNTTLGGLLAPNEGGLDQDDKIVSDGANTIKVTAENWGKSAILEKAKEIDSKILADLGSSCGELTVSPLMRFPFLTTNMMSTEGQDWDETDWNNNSYKQLSLADLNNVQIHGKVCQELNETYEKKNADYGNSFENSLDKHGLIAGIVRMDDKMSRLISLNSKKEQQVMDESLRDTLMDLANYAIMSVMWLDEQ